MATKKQVPTKTVVPLERITESILWLRGQKVMLDVDLAVLYEVQTKNSSAGGKTESDQISGGFCVSAY